MKHLQTSCFSISIPTPGWKRQNFQKQILLWLTMLERHVMFYYLVFQPNPVFCIMLTITTNESLFLQVKYHTETFLDKNRDYVVVEHCNLLSSSKCSFVAGLFPSLSQESSRSSYKFSSVASRFKVWSYLSSLNIKDFRDYYRYYFVIETHENYINSIKKRVMSFPKPDVLHYI